MKAFFSLDLQLFLISNYIDDQPLPIQSIKYRPFAKPLLLSISEFLRNDFLKHENTEKLGSVGVIPRMNKRRGSKNHTIKVNITLLIHDRSVANILIINQTIIHIFNHQYFNDKDFHIIMF